MEAPVYFTREIHGWCFYLPSLVGAAGCVVVSDVEHKETYAKNIKSKSCTLLPVLGREKVCFRSVKRIIYTTEDLVCGMQTLEFLCTVEVGWCFMWRRCGLLGGCLEYVWSVDIVMKLHAKVY